MMVTLEELMALFNEHFPMANFAITSFGNMGSTIRQPISENMLRPGGSVSGPTMFMIADSALYVAVMGEIGLQPLTVTTNLSINFLRKPAADKAMIGECKLLKCGRSLAVGEIFLYSEGDDAPVAHATGTYAIPPQRS